PGVLLRARADLLAEPFRDARSREAGLPLQAADAEGAAAALDLRGHPRDLEIGRFGACETVHQPPGDAREAPLGRRRLGAPLDQLIDGPAEHVAGVQGQVAHLPQRPGEERAGAGRAEHDAERIAAIRMLEHERTRTDAAEGRRRQDADAGSLDDSVTIAE